jgi:hypothetical protein
MPKRYFYKTPLGDFASSSQAAAAHKCDKSTVLNRCLTHPDQYQKIERAPQEPKPKTKISVIYKVTWPMTWPQYKQLAFEVREDIWINWCRNHHKDPNLEQSIDEFFSEMDEEQDTTHEQEQVV